MTLALTAPVGARPLLDAYTAGEGTLLASGGRTILARGVHATVPQPPRGDRLAGLADRTRATLTEALADGHGAALAVGAVPFDRHAAAHLVIPRHVELAGPLQLWRHDAGPVLDPSAVRVVPLPEPARYGEAVEAALAQLRSGALRKIVLARGLRVTGPEAIDPAAVIRNLVARDPRAFGFAVDLPAAADGPAGPRTLVGASPELLLRRTGLEVVANPMAGSAPRDPDAVRDAANAAALLGSPKDREEHAILVEAVREALAPLCDALEVPAGPELHGTATMWHLATRVRARLSDAATSSLHLVEALHPTPAVCGIPAADARREIARLEVAPRGFYAGAVGWQAPSGDGEWAVAIRCAELRGETATLWAGAGIVASSSTVGELAETAAKCGTMLQALGLEALR